MPLDYLPRRLVDIPSITTEQFSSCQYQYAHTHTHTHTLVWSLYLCVHVQFNLGCQCKLGMRDFVNPTALAITYRVRLWWWQQIPRWLH